jgi:uncharacterized membrane protein
MQRKAARDPRDIPSAPANYAVIDRNIEALLAKRADEERALGWQERAANAITDFAGSMLFVYLHAVLFGAWIAVNVFELPGVPRFDPTLVVLAMFASVEAIFLSTFILITQRRMMSQADRRADLTLQIALLTEHEITRLLATTAELAKRMGAADAVHPEVAELSQEVPPQQVLQQIDVQERRFSDPPPAPEPGEQSAE